MKQFPLLLHLDSASMLNLSYLWLYTPLVSCTHPAGQLQGRKGRGILMAAGVGREGARHSDGFRLGMHAAALPMACTGRQPLSALPHLP